MKWDSQETVAPASLQRAASTTPLQRPASTTPLQRPLSTTSSTTASQIMLFHPTELRTGAGLGEVDFYCEDSDYITIHQYLIAVVYIHPNAKSQKCTTYICIGVAHSLAYATLFGKWQMNHYNHPPMNSVDLHFTLLTYQIVFKV